MLRPEWISEIKVEKDQQTYKNTWKRAKLGKFSSSKIHKFCTDKLLSTGAMTYIHEKLLEEFTGVPAKTEVDNEYTRWGLLNEADGIRLLASKLSVEMLVTQTLINRPGTRYCSTPDAIWPIKKYPSGCWDVETAEVKCYPSERHIKCVLCEFAKQIKEVDPDAYWQVIDQMDNCDTIHGNLLYYHPEMKAAKSRLIKFRKIELIEDFKFLKTRKEVALQKFNELHSELLTI